MSSNRRKPVVSFTRKGKNMEHQNQTDSAGVPIIEGVNAKIGVLERRREYLQRKLDQAGYAKQPGYDFDRHEVSAIDAALRALKFHAASLRPDLDPVVHLDRVTRAAQLALDAWRSELDVGEPMNDHELALTRALKDARLALADL